VPKFLDLDLEDQQQRRLLQAWMYPDNPARLSEPTATAPAHLRRSYRAVEEYEQGALTLVCSAGTQTQFSVPNLVNETSAGNWVVLEISVPATATGVPVCLRPPIASEEPESSFVEQERIIAFRPMPARVLGAMHSRTVRLSPDAAQFVATARGRHLRFEEQEPAPESE